MRALNPHQPRPPLASRAWAATAGILAPALARYLRARAARGKEIPARLAERRGIDATPRPPGTLVWIHAASVGETVSILPVLSALAPHATILLTTGTVTSAELLEQRLPALGLTERVLHRFAPLDVPAWINRFLDHWRPDAGAFVESELWPNQLHACRTRGIPLILLNGRLSERSFDLWRRMPGFARYVLGAFHSIWARGNEDSARFRALGCAQVEPAGDLKFAAAPLPFDLAEYERLRCILAERPVWVAASTHPGEEEAIVACHGRLAERHPDLLTILVPRHPNRGAALAAAFGLPRRSVDASPPMRGIWLADTLGEMGLWYRLAPVAFVGRSLFAPGGGQNPLEPARLGRAIAVGPFTGNFVEHGALLRDADAVREVADPAGLADFVSEMLTDPARARAMGERAAAIAERQGDLPERAARAILALIVDRTET